ncbi:DNA methyltransferase [Thermopolyspora sp. NPDC052614]|uniref:Eco57I restriction-modification methylase domain-containing protein n=1 Tax=Thermopolyspora sp. NPDC052614 TaxID=3155682 RepID=UPI00342DDD76
MSNTTYLAVDVQGSLLPQDVLSRIASADRELPGMRPEDYHLAASERLGDAASRRWDYLLGAYRAFRERLEKLPGGEAATTLTRERWLLVLLSELGFGRVPFNRGGLQADGKDFPISHLWHSVPMHLLGWHTELDKSIPGVTRRAPQPMLQEFLNLSDDHLWGVLSNGRRLRVLRDSTSLVGSSYVEFDLEAIFDGELYAEFVLLYTLLHASRFELIAGDDATPTCADCWLEKWRAFAAETGLRARDQLRDGVKAALEALGTGFLVGNPKLRAQLSSGRLSREEFHHELLRLAYQLIFIFVSEDRGALLDPDAPQDAKDRYTAYFSSRRLRRLAIRRSGDRHSDLWRATAMVIAALGDDDGLPRLALPGLGGLFFRTADSPAVLTDEPRPDQLLRCDLSNDALLTAVRKICTVRAKDGRPRDVDYRHLGAEELGSIYESLLELVPYAETNGAGTKFELKEKVSGNDRKLTGSYYTPSSLIESLLDTALDPVIDEHAKSGNPDDLLKITVCDPACGSGHFLVAAARRIAKRHAAMVTGEDEPVPSAVREAMYKVVATCIYGVDINPLAAELAKVSLWIESLEPGKPLAFLDAHIKVGNSLLGTTPRLITAGIPDDAFKPIEGDDRKVVSALKRQNAREVQRALRETDSAQRGTQEALFDETDLPGNQKLAEETRALATMSVSRVADVREQERRFYELDKSDDLKRARLVADSWCAAFVWRKHDEAPDAITTATIRSLEAGVSLAQDRADELRRLRQQYGFFHWYLEFPAVFRTGGSVPGINPETGWSGGFNCVLGNPPWDSIVFNDKEFFGSRAPDIAKATSVRRKHLIAGLTKNNPTLASEYQAAVRATKATHHLVGTSNLFPLNSRGMREVRGVNTYKTDTLFIEKNRTLLSSTGRLGLIIPTNFATDAASQFLFKDLLAKHSLVSLYDFENSRALFPRVHRSYKFSLLTAIRSNHREANIDFAFFLQDPSHLTDREIRFTLTASEINTLNPNTGTCPVFRTRRDAEITLGIYQRVPIFIRKSAPEVNSWNVNFTRMFDMTDDAHLFHTREQLESDSWEPKGNIYVKNDARMLPLQEGKMGHAFDHRFSMFTGPGDTDLSPIVKSSPDILSIPRYWVPESATEQEQARHTFRCRTAFLGHRRVARNTDDRTCIATLMPWGAASYGWIISAGPSALELTLLAAVFNSFVYDYLLRGSLTQPSIPQSTSEQIPVPIPQVFKGGIPWRQSAEGMGESDLSSWIESRVFELSYTAYDMEPFARDLGDNGTPFVWNVERRELIRAELDAALFHLYGVARDDIHHILETFTIVKRKDLAKYGEFRTKRLILEIYDAMQSAIDGYRPYQTPLSPPPGEGPRYPKR